MEVYGRSFSIRRSCVLLLLLEGACNSSSSGAIDAAVVAADALADTASPDAGPVVPDEILNLIPNVWTPISRNLFSDVDPCPDRTCGYSAVNGQGGVIDAYNGGVFADAEGSLGGLALWGGGHNGYYGNEMYLFDLATLRWSRRSEPTVGQIPGDETSFGLDPETCRFYDGKPLPPHTYDSVSYLPTTHQFVIASLGDVPSSPPSNPEVGCKSLIGAAFNFETGDWEELAEVPDTQKYTITEFDSKRNALWVWRTIYGTGGLARYDVPTKTWTSYASDQAPPVHATGAIDLDHDLLVALRFYYADPVGITVKDLANPDAPGVTITTIGGTEIEQEAQLGKGFVGFEWVPAFGRFVAWVSGSSLYYLTPPEGDWRTEAWVWSRVQLEGTPPTVPGNRLGPAGKFQVAPKLGIALTLTHRSDPVYAVKLQEPE